MQLVVPSAKRITRNPTISKYSFSVQHIPDEYDHTRLLNMIELIVELMK